MSDPGQRDHLPSLLAGQYAVDRELGAGGMATVYLAHDRKHDRRVAIKVLHAELAAVLGADRFLQEIKLTANLQHPHILGLIDSGVFGDDAGALHGRPFYVMPYVDGESLRQRLEREQQLSVTDAVRIAREVASALDYAHRHNVIHRDIKPENILLHDGSALVADFGIALAVQSAGGQRMTQTGLSLGTPQYMSPEQAMGERTISARSDIYALGAVLYEMLTGEPPFSGPTVQAVVARLMSEQPRSVTAQRRSVPAYVESAVLKALEKVPADRFDSAAEFGEALADAGQHVVSTEGSLASAARGYSRSTVMALATIAAVAIFAAVISAWKVAHQTAPPVALKLDFPSSHRYRPGPSLAVSPDGRTIAYVGVTASGIRQLFVRSLGSIGARAVPGAVSPTAPSFSDDGRFIVYSNSVDISRIPLEGGAPTTIVPSPTLTGLSAVRGGDVVYVALGHLWRVRGGGEKPQSIAELDSSHGELVMQSPIVLPDAQSVAYTVVRQDPQGTRASIAISSINGGGHSVVNGLESERVIGHEEGCLLYVDAGGNLMAVRFDLKARRASGEPIALIPSSGPPSSEIYASLSPSGTLAYATGGQTASLTVLDEKGASSFVVPEHRLFEFPVWSPDGKRLAVGVRTTDEAYTGGDGDIWIYDIAARVLSRLTSNAQSARPAWSADGKRVAYVKQVGSRSEIWWVAADGSGQEERLLALGGENGRTPEVTFSPDGRFAVVRAAARGAGVSNNDVVWKFWATPLSNGQSELLFDTKGSVFHPVVSPDSKWIAYVSRVTGVSAVYVRPFPHGGGPVQISTGLATEPRWSSDGRRLLYRDERAFRAARLSFAGDKVVVIARDSLFADPEQALFKGHQRYDVHPDGKHLVTVRASGDGEVYVITNWLSQVREKLRRAGTR